MELSPEVRPVPLKIAGVIGMLTSALYLTVVLNQGDGLGPELFWLVLMATGALLAWYANRFEGRRGAMAAAAIFFVLGLVSPWVLAVAFLIAVALCVAGFVDFAPNEL